MTSEAWRHYMAQFMAEVRAALPPQVEIVHNVIWFADNQAGTRDPDIAKEISSADYISLERGVNDSGLTGGNGPWSVTALLAYIDEIHHLGKGVILAGEASDPAGLEYNLAAYFLISTGRDGVSGGGQTPANWWPGYDIRLGAPMGPRQHWRGLWRRDYARGLILLNPPDSPPATIRLPIPMVNTNGHTVTSVTLDAASGAVLRTTRADAADLARSAAASSTSSSPIRSAKTILGALFLGLLCVWGIVTVGLKRSRTKVARFRWQSGKRG